MSLVICSLSSVSDMTKWKNEQDALPNQLQSLVWFFFLIHWIWESKSFQLEEKNKQDTGARKFTITLRGETPNTSLKRFTEKETSNYIKLVFLQHCKVTWETCLIQGWKSKLGWVDLNRALGGWCRKRHVPGHLVLTLLVINWMTECLLCNGSKLKTTS